MDSDVILNGIYSVYLAFLGSSFFFYLKIFSALISTILLIDIILLMSKRIRTDIRFAFYGTPSMRFKKSKYIPLWDSVQARLAEGSIASGKLAIIEADKMLDEALGKMGYAGRNTEEKISKVKPGQLVGIDEVRNIHHLHDMILEDPTHEASPGEIRNALDAYERVLRGVGMID
jgi:hypothetical protein